MKRPEMKDFDHPIDFAKAMFEYLKATRNLSFRVASKNAGFHSPNYILLLFKKERVIGSRAAAEGITKALEFTEEEANKFICSLEKNYMDRCAHAWHTNKPQRVRANRRVPDFKGKLLAAVHGLAGSDEY